jgi:glucose-6-phosphate isomerase
MSELTQSKEWQNLKEHQKKIAGMQMRQMFSEDPDRFKKFSLEFNDILLDYSKNRITEETMKLLLRLAESRDLKSWIEKMFSGEKINITENRAVLHTALRNRSGRPVNVDGKNVMPEVERVLQQMRKFSEAVRSGQWKGYTGKEIIDVVNIGIGGSDLGPVMVTEAL